MMTSDELKKITGVKAEKLDDKSYIKITMTGIIVKQNGYRDLWLLIVGENNIQRGKNVEEIFQNLGYTGNIRYSTKKTKKKKNPKLQ